MASDEVRHFRPSTKPWCKDSERRGENKISKLVSDIFYPEPHPILFKDSESRKQWQTETKFSSLTMLFFSGPRVAARGDARIIPHLDAISRKYRPSHSALDAESRKCMGRRARKIHSLLCPSTGPRVAARGDVWSYRTPMRYLVRIVLASESLSGKWGGRVGNPRKNCIFVLPENLKTRDRYGD